MANYYEILGVSKTADEKAIKNAYRRLMRKYHPDLNPGDKAAEDKAKEINNAHDTLSDPAKRKEYDYMLTHGTPNPPPRRPNPGASGTATGYTNVKFHFHDLRANEDIHVQVESTADDTLRTSAHKISYVRKTGECSKCKGTGGTLVDCPHCNGTGHHFMVANGVHVPIGICVHCRGQKKVRTEACDECHGVGFESELVKLEVQVPKGGGIAQPLRIKGKGHHLWKDLPPGNLFITIGSLIKDHYEYDHNLNCIYRLKIDPVEAIIGCTKEIPGLAGAKHTIEIKPGAQQGLVEVINKSGICVSLNGDRTDLIVALEYQAPVNLTEDQKTHLKAYLNSK